MIAALGPGSERKETCNVGALIIRIGFGGIVYYNYKKEPPEPYSKY